MSKSNAPKQKHTASPEKSKAVLDRLLEEGIIPHATQISECWVAGALPVVAFKMTGIALAAWQAMFPGLDPTANPVVGIIAAELASSIKAGGGLDFITEAWLQRAPTDDEHPIYVMAHEGCLLVNHRMGHGFSIEPGSLDQDFS